MPRGSIFESADTNYERVRLTQIDSDGDGIADLFDKDYKPDSAAEKQRLIQQDSDGDGVADYYEPYCPYDNFTSGIGIGLIIIQDSIEIFDDSELRKQVFAGNVYYLNKFEYCPRYYKPDYGILHFTCLEDNGLAYKITVNNSEIKYLPKKSSYVFKTWPEYLSASFGIRAKSANRVKKQPRENATEVPFDQSQWFCPLRFKGDWIEIELGCKKEEGQNCERKSACGKAQTAWLRWKRKELLLIDIAQLP